MNYLILAETEFFGLINADAESCNLNTAYDDFIKAIIKLCCGSTDTTETVVALAYMENEFNTTVHGTLRRTMNKYPCLSAKPLPLCERYRSILLQTISPKCHH